MVRIKTWFVRHRPSGVVTGFLAFFIISYIVITKLDNTDRLQVKEIKEADPLPPVAKVIRTHKNVIPMQILAEFAQDEENEKRKIVAEFAQDEANEKHKNYDFYDDSENYTDYSVDKHRVFIPSNAKIGNNNNVKYVSTGENFRTTTKNGSNKFVVNRSKTFHETGEVKSAQKIMTVPSRTSAHKLIHIFNVMEESQIQMDSVKSNKCVQLKTLHGNAPICIHSPDDDEIISGKLSKQGNWEANYLYVVGSVLSQNPYMEFLDLGCNVGVYTILAAKVGHRVMALDPNKINLRLLTRSLNMGGLSNKVTLLWNAVSNVRENVTLFDTIGNIGGTFVETADKEDVEDETIDEEHKAIAITLDDLTDFFKGKQLFIKMDIETYELKALKGGHRFFSEVHVQYVLMEWIYHREFDTGKQVIELMKRYHLFPHVNAHKITKLEPQFYKSWPDNILWIKY